MRRLIHLNLLVFFSCTLFLVLFPKTNLYYFLEKNLLKYNVILSNENTTENLMSLDVNNVDVYYRKSPFAIIEKSSFLCTLFVNKITLENVTLSKVPLTINFLEFNYGTMNPTNIDIQSYGSFGKLNGKVNLLDRKVNLILHLKSKELLNSEYAYLIKKMKYSKGEYRYEYKF